MLLREQLLAKSTERIHARRPAGRDELATSATETTKAPTATRVTPSVALTPNRKLRSVIVTGTATPSPIAHPTMAGVRLSMLHLRAFDEH